MALLRTTRRLLVLEMKILSYMIEMHTIEVSAQHAYLEPHGN